MTIVTIQQSLKRITMHQKPLFKKIIPVKQTPVRLKTPMRTRSVADSRQPSPNLDTPQLAQRRSTRGDNKKESLSANPLQRNSPQFLGHRKKYTQHFGQTSSKSHPSFGKSGAPNPSPPGKTSTHPDGTPACSAEMG